MAGFNGVSNNECVKEGFNNNMSEETIEQLTILLDFSMEEIDSENRGQVTVQIKRKVSKLWLKSKMK